jgi:pyruvate dehydrogenase E2 component (dihydrolipoamide acetyltransferase)
VTRLLVEEGQTVPVGQALALLGPVGADVEAAPATVLVGAGTVGQPEAAVVAAPPAGMAATSLSSTRRPSLTPVLRHLAHELGVDPTTLHGTGRDGALTRHDVEQAAAAARATSGDGRHSEAAHRARVTPLARRLAAEQGLDLTSVHGTGPDGSVRADDVRRATRHTGSAAPPEESAAPGVEAGATTAAPAPPPMSDMRRSIAALMTVSNQQIPHYHLSLTIDLWRSLQWMKERNRELEMSERLVPAALLLAATARAARAVPELNGHWIDGAFRPAADVDLGLILSLRSGGLLVPAIGGADRLSVEEMMARVKVLTRRARSGRLRGSDLTPPSITVSNLGDQGVDSVLGVIYPPQVALVGFGAVAERPWAVDGLLGVRPLVTVTLAGDHRATDGATGSRLLKTIDRLLQAPEEL